MGNSYLDISERDLRSAEIMLDAGVYNNCARFCEQSVEKLLNHYIEKSSNVVEHMRLLGVHNVVLLYKAFCDIFSLKMEVHYTHLSRELKDMYYDTNYPGDNYIEISKEDAERLYAETMQFIKYIRSVGV